MAASAHATRRPSNHPVRPEGQRGRSWLWAAGAIALLLQTSCVVLPVRVASGVTGRVVDRDSGEPVSDAIVVVRFEGHHDDILPDREVIGHRETRTDTAGRFSVGSIVRPGVSAWPMYRTQARVVTVLRDGYRCAAPEAIAETGEVRIDLQRAFDMAERRDSCRPVPAKRGETTEYLAAWRDLYPQPDSAEQREAAREIDRLMASRSVFSFGENCEGPALDLSLSPDGQRAAYVLQDTLSLAARDGRPEEATVPGEIHVVELKGNRTGLAKAVAQESQQPARRLAWMSPGDLVLWEPAAEAHRSVSPSTFSSNRFERVWSTTGPASPAGSRPLVESDLALREGPQLAPLEPEDLNDEGDSRWLGRSFVHTRRPDPVTGRPIEQLRIHKPDGTTHVVGLPGETCGPAGRFGRPHYRIAADARTALDLRYVEDGCHVVRTDLETGEWAIVDDPAVPAICQPVRRVPAMHFAAALRGYARELETSVSDAGGDPDSAFALRILEDGATVLDTRTFSGEPLSLEVAPFPMETPLRRIEVSILGSVPRVRGRPAVTGLQPL